MYSGRPIIDSHVHVFKSEDPHNLITICDSLGIAKTNIACLSDSVYGNTNPAALQIKSEYPERIYAFAALDHSTYLTSGEVTAPPFAEQVDRFIDMGMDGLKMLENKPTERKLMDIPVDGDIYEPLFQRLEETGFPVLWHVADPEEFWDPNTTPKWAKDRGWGYDETYQPKEQLYREVENVLSRHPKLRIIFAHFYFLSADLSRAAAFFERFENIHFDLAPGIEMLYNMSKDVQHSRDFFIKYSDRIIFGTDISAGQSITEAGARAGIVRRWLETDDEFRVPDDADFLLGPPEDGVIRGMSLPDDVLERIYHANFERLVAERA